MATRDEILFEWQKMAAAYPASFVRFDEDQITANQLVWIEQLSDIAPDLLRIACANYRSSDAEWFPAAGKIRAMAFRLADSVALFGEISPDYDELLRRRNDRMIPDAKRALLCDAQEIKQLAEAKRL